MIRVLALNDDNHETSFTIEDGRRFYTKFEFITEVLAKPHAEEYVVRGYAIIDEPEGRLADYECEQVDAIFDLVANDFSCDIVTFEEGFDLIWETSGERWY